MPFSVIKIRRVTACKTGCNCVLFAYSDSKIKMMKALPLIVFFLIYSAGCFGQDYKVIDTVRLTCEYEYYFQQDSASKNTPAYQNMILQVGKNYSKFCTKTTLLKDSIIYAKQVGGSSQSIMDKLVKIAQGSPNNLLCKYEIYKNYPQKVFLTLNSLLNRDYKFQVVQTAIIDWSVDERDTVICGYNCNMATTSYAGRRYVAWFTSEIPVSEGPYKFNGLPGLILYIMDDQKQHVFKIISIQQPKLVRQILYYDDNYLKVSPEQYVLGIQKSKLYTREFVMGLSTTPERRARALYNLDIKNNFIERY